MVRFVPLLVAGFFLSFAPQTSAVTNDFFADAAWLTQTADGWRGDGNLLGSTLEPGEPRFSPIVSQGSIWYKFAPPSTATYKMRHLSSDPASYIFRSAFYEGTAVDQLTKIPLVEFKSSLSAGNTYYLNIQKIFAGNEPVSFVVVPIPANDDLANAALLAGATFQFQGVLSDGSIENSESPHLPKIKPASSIWYRWTAPESGDGLLYIDSAQANVSVMVMDGTNWESVVHFPLTSAQTGFATTIPFTKDKTYSIGLYGDSGPVAGHFLFKTAGAPTNDFRSEATLIAGSDVRVEGNLLNSTLEPGENPAVILGFLYFGSIWYRWIAPVTGHLNYSVEEAPGSNEDGFHVMAHPGGAKASGNLFVWAGQEYHFSVTRPESITNGIVHLRLGLQAGITNDAFANALTLIGASYFQASNIDSTREPLEPTHSAFANPKSIWFKWSSLIGATVHLWFASSEVTNVAWAVYQGDSLAGLKPIANGTNACQFLAAAGREYRIALETPGDETGMMNIAIQDGQDWVLSPNAENILVNGGFEADAWSEPGWVRSDTGVSVNTGESAPEEKNFRILFNGSLSQEVPTTPGHHYQLRVITFPIEAGSGVPWLNLEWGNQSFVNLPWNGRHRHIFTATSTSTRLAFSGWGVALDDVSIVDLSEPPVIVVAPSNLSAIVGSDISFTPTITGTEPYIMQWFHDNQPLAGATNFALFLQSVSESMAGSYHFAVTNDFGSAVSSPFTLSVQTVAAPEIRAHPAALSAIEGSYSSLTAIAVGASPLSYQWLKDGVVVANATNSTIVFSSVAAADSGVYSFRVTNDFGAVLSLPATLSVIAPSGQGPIVNIDNADFFSLLRPVYDVDGQTGLRDPIFRAQFYAGASPETLAPCGSPVSFYDSPAIAGVFQSMQVHLWGLSAPAQLHGQVRAWDSSRGATYEEARARGGRFGASAVFTFQSAPFPAFVSIYLPASFSLRAGMPEFNVGRLEILSSSPEQVNIRLHGSAGFRYLIERKSVANSYWLPQTVVTNDSGIVDFTDTSAVSGSVYRSRILE